MRDGIRQKLDDAILYLYRELRYPVFPVQPESVVRRVYRCRYISYDDLARVSGTSYEEVVRACNSIDGCTQYDPASGRYLVAINTSDRRGASPARIRWTTAHELGHIAAGHFVELASRTEGGLQPSEFHEMEEEADYFASAFLAPSPAIQMLRAKNPANVRDWFGLSQTAAEYRWSDFRNVRCDERLEDYFYLFRPRSEVKDAQRMDTRKINVFKDSL